MRTLQAAFYRWVAAGVSFPDVFFVADLENGGAHTRARGRTCCQLHARTVRRFGLSIARKQVAAGPAVANSDEPARDVGPVA